MCLRHVPDKMFIGLQGVCVWGGEMLQCGLQQLWSCCLGVPALVVLALVCVHVVVRQLFLKLSTSYDPVLNLSVSSELTGSGTSLSG